MIPFAIESEHKPVVLLLHLAIHASELHRERHGRNPIQEIEPDQEANEGNCWSSDQYRFSLRPFQIALIDQLDHAQRHSHAQRSSEQEHPSSDGPDHNGQEEREEAKGGQGVKRNEQAQVRKAVAQEFVGHQQQNKHT